MGKITKTEKYLLLLTAIFLLCLALLYFTDHRSAGGGDYTVTPQYTAQEPEAPDPPAVPGKVNINTADAAQLEALDGIGPTLAQRIVAYREEHGPFADIESIMDVNGIGEGIHSTFRSFRGKVDSYAFDTVVWVEAVNGTVHFEWIPICENDLAVQQLCQRNRERCFPRSRGTADHDDISLVCQTAFPAPFW